MSEAHVDAVRFLSALAGSASAAEFLELRYRLDDGERMGQLFEPPHRLDALATRALALGRQTDVYVGCAPRARRYGGRTAVIRGFTLWADCDGTAAAQALANFEPEPSIVLASGTGDNRHAFWPLATPLERIDLERANRRLALALGADPGCAEPARILRIPGTRSHKHMPPMPVVALRLDTDRRLAASEVVGGLADPPPDERAANMPRPRQRADDPLLMIEPAVYVARLLGVEIPRHRKVPCPFHPDGRPSFHVYDSAQRGWYCFGRCRRGGTIYDLAAPLYGYEPRGAEFLRLRSELRRLFGLESA